jgi:hypothetical protein
LLLRRFHLRDWGSKPLKGDCMFVLVKGCGTWSWRRELVGGAADVAI